MGMYDEVIIKCPKCSKQFSEQTRMGKGVLGIYFLGELPEEVAIDIAESKVYCPHCGVKVKFMIESIMRLVPYCE